MLWEILSDFCLFKAGIMKTNFKFNKTNILRKDLLCDSEIMNLFQLAYKIYKPCTNKVWNVTTIQGLSSPHHLLAAVFWLAAI